MNSEDITDDKNYTFYNSNIVLPRVSRIKSSERSVFAQENVKPQVINVETKVNLMHDILPNGTHHSSPCLSDKNIKVEHPEKSRFSSPNIRLDTRIDFNEVKLHNGNEALFVPRPPSTDSLSSYPIHRKYNSLKSKNNQKPDQCGCNNKIKHDVNCYSVDTIDINSAEEPYLLSEEAKDKSNQNMIEEYTNYIEKRYKKENSTKEINSSLNKSLSSSDEDEISISSLSDTALSDNDNSKDTPDQSFQPLYSLPRKYNKDNIPINGNTNYPLLNKLVLSNSINPMTQNGCGSLPDLRSINKFQIKRISHVEKNESEAESEPAGQIGYKFRPLPPIPSTLDSSNIYETLNGKSLEVKESPKKKSFREVAKFLTLMPKLTTHSVRSRKSDHHLSDISQYLPERKLKIFIGTWNMKGTKSLPDSLENFLLPMESMYLQDIYVIGTQEGTPFRREWQVRLQETFGPSHVLMQSSNFGVLQLSIFVRRELVWFCSSIEQDTTATRVGHKIKTKGALAMSFNVFGTSFLFLTSHFTSHEGKLQDRINDYNSICQNIQLPYREVKGSEKDVTTRFDRVFWFGDFNFRVKKARSYVDKLIADQNKSTSDFLEELLPCDQLNNLFERRKIFHGFSEAPIKFMPTYKFDVNTSRYDTSSKQRVPSWTDRIVHKSIPTENLQSVCYNSCNSIKVSDHRPVYAIFETIIEPFKSNFTFDGGQFDREVYVEANLRRNAPNGTQEQSHVCTIL